MRDFADRLLRRATRYTIGIISTSAGVAAGAVVYGVMRRHQNIVRMGYSPCGPFVILALGKSFKFEAHVCSDVGDDDNGEDLEADPPEVEELDAVSWDDDYQPEPDIPALPAQERYRTPLVPEASSACCGQDHNRLVTRAR